MLAATTAKGFDNVRIEDDLTFRLSQTDDQQSSSDRGDDQIDANSFIGSIKSKGGGKWPTLVPL